ncbi:selection and upkeep of intraepithelial T-cells protein 1 isoform X2 [Nilaparvata lugens]|uniref:selection and upkeep of intraepithelial T-cells protein 1 isoform X2 n=1 Tax=Nilaparvata lugens TaxID=108931 RepID=UPI00193E5183|nr:selection and upkeep of intraepithelial T-cells protein 1 isoform X2 [Nilaparvata lugens]
MIFRDMDATNMKHVTASHSATCSFFLIVFSFVLATLLTGGETVEIKSLRVPEVVQNGSEASVVLDCDYNVENKAGLVVKWFFNNQTSPVYQWILNKKPQDLGVLKGKLNLDYRASDDETKKHRAMQILRPTTELSGEYRCIVSTFDGEDSEAKKMIIYVPERTIELKQMKPNEDRVKVECSAEGVYPEPRMTINTNSAGSDRKEPPLPVEIIKERADGLFDISVSILIEDRELQSPTTFSCELSIPEANYTVRRQSVYYPDSSNSSSCYHLPHWIMSAVLILTIGRL